jgi:hypothetical protein
VADVLPTPVDEGPVGTDSAADIVDPASALVGTMAGDSSATPMNTTHMAAPAPARGSGFFLLMIGIALLGGVLLAIAARLLLFP